MAKSGVLSMDGVPSMDGGTAHLLLRDVALLQGYFLQQFTTALDQRIAALPANTADAHAGSSMRSLCAQNLHALEQFMNKIHQV